MNLVLLCISVALIIFAVVIIIISAYQKSEYSNEIPKIYHKLKKYALILAVILGLFNLSTTIVPTGYTGVRTTFGQVSSDTITTGFNWKIPLVQQIELVNNKQQDKKISAEVWGETEEKTPVFASNIVVTYQIGKDKASWIYANVSDTDNLIEQNLIESSVKSAMVELNVKEVTNRSKIEPLVKEKLSKSLTDKYGDGTVNVLKVVINNMDFEKSYNEAIAAKSVAQQKYEKQKIENETAIAKAESDKKVAIAKAEAESKATLIKAKAQADANKMLVDSLTDKVLQSRFYEKWNGELPTVMGENAVITDIGKQKGK